MHAHGPTDYYLSRMIAGERGAGERGAGDDRRLAHLVALAEARAGCPSLLDRALARLPRRAAATPEPTLDCAAA